LEVLVYLINFNSKQIRFGNFKNIRDHLDMFKLGLAKEIFLLDGQFSKSTFQNIVSFDFADQFIQDFASKLHLPNASALVYLSSTRVLIGRKQFQNALKLLSKISFKEYPYDSVRRSYQLMCLVELKERPILINNYCDNFLLFIRRDKSQSADVLAGNKNFVLVIQKLLKGVPKEEIKEFINQQKAVVYRTWLLEQLE